MAMRENGLVKLTEECAEAIQVAAKLIAYPELQSPDNLDLHPDGTDLRIRLEEELADAWAAIEFVKQKLGLDSARITSRALAKMALFRKWDREP